MTLVTFLSAAAFDMSQRPRRWSAEARRNGRLRRAELRRLLRRLADDVAAQPSYTLLRFDSGLDVASLARAAHTRGVPLRILDVKEPAPAAFECGGLVLSRPDQHVAWRGKAAPVDPAGLIDRVRGAAR